MKLIIQKLLQHQVFLEKPPVLLDIGASGNLPSQWKLLSKYSIGIAFDADSRDFSVAESKNSDFKKLYLLNRIVCERSERNVKFYLTHSPHCSSSLPPHEKELAHWAFSQSFGVESICELEAVELISAINKCGINYVDWFKIDSQGTDWRIFKSLPDEVSNKVIVAEFEPGIIDAYIGEDKLDKLLFEMSKRPFWISSMDIKGSQRINIKELEKSSFFQKKFIRYFLRTAPGWCEIAFINKFEAGDLEFRDYLLGWIFSSIKNEHGFAWHLAEAGYAKYKNPIFLELSKISSTSIYSFKNYINVFFKIFKNRILLALRKLHG